MRREEEVWCEEGHSAMLSNLCLHIYTPVEGLADNGHGLEKPRDKCPVEPIPTLAPF